jgi:hypothetical protein
MEAEIFAAIARVTVVVRPVMSSGATAVVLTAPTVS